MKKHFLLLCLIAVSLIVDAQVKFNASQIQLDSLTIKGTTINSEGKMAGKLMADTFPHGRIMTKHSTDSIIASSSGGVQYSDTAAMLLPYLRKVDTTSMLSYYLRKVDTTAMLLPYLRSVDAFAYFVPLSRTISINGVSQDLSANRSWTIDSTNLIGFHTYNYYATNPFNYLTSYTETDPVWLADQSSYLTIASAASTYSVLGHTHSFASLTSTPTTIAGYGITDFNSLGDARWSLLAHTHSFSSLTGIPTTLSGYGITDAVAANVAITGATKTKITYDTKGLVTAGADATTADIAASTDKNYVTDAQLVVIGNTSGTNTGDQTTVSGNAGSATTTAITNDNTTSATMYPTWVTGTTGNLSQKVSSTKLTFNPLFGNLTTTLFTGNLAGNVTGDVTGNVSGSSGSCTGNAATATALATARTIAITGDLTYTSPSFDGSGNVTAAGTVAKINGSTLGTTTATDKNILIANGSSWVSQAVSGDITIGNTGVTAIGTGKVNSTMLLDGTILNADVNTSAAIDVSKLAAGTSAQLLLNSSTPTPTWTTISGDVTIGNTGVTAIGATKVTNAMLAGSIDLTTKVTGALPIANGGTAGTTAATAKNNLGMYVMQMTNGNQTTTSNTAQNITDLVQAVSVSSTYSFSGYIAASCNNTGGVKFAVTIPTGATMDFSFQGLSTAGTGYLHTIAVASGTLTATAYVRFSDVAGYGIIVSGTVITDGTHSGNVQFQFASGTSGQTSTIYQLGTFIHVEKIQ